MSEELLPCPFCGDDAGIEKSNNPKGGIIVKCKDFDCQTYKWGGTQGAAIKKWNARAKKD